MHCGFSPPGRMNTDMQRDTTLSGEAGTLKPQSNVNGHSLPTACGTARPLSRYQRRRCSPNPNMVKAVLPSQPTVAPQTWDWIT